MKENYSILFIDNNENITNSLEKYVKENINWLNVVGNLKNEDKNIKYILQNKPNIIICNSIYPLFTNLMNIEKIKQIKNNSKIFIFSGNTDFYNINNCNQPGITKFIKKPIKLYDLFNIIKNSTIKKV